MEKMEVIDDNGERVILKRSDGALIWADDDGFEMKNLPNCGKSVKTTEWAD